MKVVLYPTDNSIAVMSPTGVLSTMETAKKDVPAGTPFIIVDVADLPTEPQEAWIVDFSQPDGIGGQND